MQYNRSGINCRETDIRMFLMNRDQGWVHWVSSEGDEEIESDSRRCARSIDSTWLQGREGGAVCFLFDGSSLKNGSIPTQVHGKVYLSIYNASLLVIKTWLTRRQGNCVSSLELSLYNNCIFWMNREERYHYIGKEREELLKNKRIKVTHIIQQNFYFVSFAFISNDRHVCIIYSLVLPSTQFHLLFFFTPTRLDSVFFRSICISLDDSGILITTWRWRLEDDEEKYA